jgi:DNA polymerase III epsilon subunit-like protein
MKKTLILDLETGGLNSTTDAICSITVKKFGEDNTLKTWYLKPNGREYNLTAMEVNGLSEQWLLDNGITINQCYKELEEYICNNFTSNDLGWIKLLGHNISFDIDFLKKVFGNLHKKYFHYHFKDSMIVSEYLRDSNILRINSLSLTNVYKYIFGKDKLLSKAHTSEADVLMTEKIYSYFINQKFL